MLQTWSETPAVIAGVSPVNPSEIVVYGVERHGGDVVFQLLREAVRQTGNRRIDIRMVRFWRST